MGSPSSEPSLGPVTLFDLVVDQSFEELGAQGSPARSLRFVELQGMERGLVDDAHPEECRHDELDRQQEDVREPFEP